jgi:opacity protein-like surface antigen
LFWQVALAHNFFIGEIMQRISKHIVKGLVAAIIVAAPVASLKAEDVRWGGMVGLVNPMGDMTKKYSVSISSYGYTEWSYAKMGVGLHGFVEKELGDKLAIRGRLSITAFTGDSQEYTTGGGYWKWKAEGSTSAFSGYCDFLLRLQDHNNGLYLLGGLGFISGSVNSKITETDLDLEVYDESDTSAGLACALGAGFNFTENFGLELTYNRSLGMKDNEKLIPEFTWIDLSFVYRF